MLDVIEEKTLLLTRKHPCVYRKRMLPATRGKHKAKARVPRTRFPGICQFAAEQGVDRVHAYRVLCGLRESRKLLTAWRTFQSRRAA